MVKLSKITKQPVKRQRTQDLVKSLARDNLKGNAKDVRIACEDLKRAKGKLDDAEDDYEREAAKEEIFDLKKELKNLRQEKQTLWNRIRE